MTTKPRWTCDVCHQPVTRNGYLEFRYAEWHVHREASKAWEERHMDPSGLGTVWNIGDGDNPPGYVRWRTFHIRCDPRPERADSYWIGIERLSSWHKVADWSAHLHGKRWFADTDWSRLLEDAGAGEAAA